MKSLKVWLLIPLFCSSFVTTQAQTIRKENDGIAVVAPKALHGSKMLRLKVWTDRVIQVIATPVDTVSRRPSLVVSEPQPKAPVWKLDETPEAVTVSTPALVARVEKSTLRVSFQDKAGHPFVTEGERSIRAATVEGEACFGIKQAFQYSAGEVLYGLGSYQSADVALNGKKVTLLQKNRDDVVPVIVSSVGYALLWDNTAYGEFNDTKDGFYLWSEAADEIRYFLIAGKSTDSLVAAYRALTGPVPMYPKWAFGYIQSKQKYNTQDEIVSIVKEFRKRQFPLDVIVQDWMYWPDGQWGQKTFFRKNYPDPTGMVNAIHAMNTKVMISIWPNMTKGTPDQTQLAAIHGLYADDEHLDVMMPEARQLYWKQVNDSLLSTGIDALWADCSEGYDSDWTSPYFKVPDVALNELNAGTLRKMMRGGRYINAYALMHTKGLYEGWRSSPSQKRVMILTRSSFAGMQRYGASYWTGDVSANWEEFRMQIPAGINYCMTGIPFWTTDIAGYFLMRQPGWWFANGMFPKGQEDQGFNELYTRWFQFAAFCPLFRAHGADFPREPWAFGPPASRTYQTLKKFTDLRYRLLPYIYSMAWKVSAENYTMMRGLPFDFSSDPDVLHVNDQFMFGPALLVNPVVRPLYFLPDNVPVKGAKLTRSVYLPKGTSWYDFWTGKKYDGGTTVEADASYETMPLFVRAGSLLPLGPQVQYSTEATDPIELRIYRGANGQFALYEDENDNYNYLKGQYAQIPFRWNEAAARLTIGARQGSFPGMPQAHTFKIVLVGEQRGVGGLVSGIVDKTVLYTGKETAIDF